jgi:hypothetical protein
LRFTNQAVEIAKRPDHEAYPALKQHETHFADAPELAQQMLPIFGRFANLQERRALIGCAVAGLAAERYRLLHDRWPNQLDDMPADPYDGKPLRYRKTPDGIVIYSIGPAGVGNGAALDANPPKVSDSRIEFRLWDSDQR